MHNLCVIPARGGSKRIPRKNIKDFLGKPIIAYSIEAALGSGLFEEVMVSTPLDRYEPDVYELAELLREETGLSYFKKKNRVNFPKNPKLFKLFGVKL